MTDHDLEDGKDASIGINHVYLIRKLLWSYCRFPSSANVLVELKSEPLWLQDISHHGCEHPHDFVL